MPIVAEAFPANNNGDEKIISTRKSQQQFFCIEPNQTKVDIFDPPLHTKTNLPKHYILYFYCMEVREPAIAYGKEKMSIEAYLEMENAADEKHEYYQGEIFDMSGAKVPHNRIAKNFLGVLFNKLKGKKCEPFNSDQRIHIPSNTLFQNSLPVVN